MNVIEIKDFGNPALDVYARLTEAQLRNRLETEKGIFIAESVKVIEVALKCGLKPISFLSERRHIDGNAKKLFESCPDVPVYTADDGVLAGYTGYAVSRGVLCAMRRPKPKTPEEILENASRVAILENITDVTNVGAIVRSAAALGMDGILLTPSCCDPLYRRAVRVSMGTVFQIPWAYIGQKPSDWPEKGMAILKEKGFKTAALALSDNSVSVDNAELAGEKKLALILGTEGDGLSEKTIAESDYTVKIPMYHGVDSLNVAAASAVAFWQLGKRK